MTVEDHPAPLKDLELFRRFRLDEELNAITWPSGADLAPEFLYEQASRGADSGGSPRRRSNRPA
ncbi:MAG: DUF2442 domain-containing protein [Planctomycetes bacterium]|nr:DUF2442 domain-containing protein [Planctomycetota bacterium]